MPNLRKVKHIGLKLNMKKPYLDQGTDRGNGIIQTTNLIRNPILQEKRSSQMSILWIKILAHPTLEKTSRGRVTHPNHNLGRSLITTYLLLTLLFLNLVFKKIGQKFIDGEKDYTRKEKKNLEKN